MYRKLIPFLMCVLTAVAAPQYGNSASDITYVKVQPVTERNTELKSNNREYRLENVALETPGKVANEKSDEEVEKTAVILEKGDNTSEKEISDSNDDKVDKSDDKINDNDAESKRRVRSEDTTSSYESDTSEPTEGVTELEDVISQTEAYESRTRAPSPRFLSKLSYFQKGNGDVRSSIATNLLERTGKRGFKTKCRCEKDWNCPKLQITVARCPNDYFLCC